MIFADLIGNLTLVAALSAWLLAQVIKMPLHYLLTRKIDWSLLFRAGGMPSSHSAIISSCAISIGLNSGFNSQLFTLAVVIAMIVIYDATGIRRQAGMHAKIINTIVQDMVEGHPLRRREQLLEVLGHSPREAFIGVLLGITVALLAQIWLV